ncbi:thioredoxin family protein [Caldanaerobacter sp.]|uniref:thioredoxin family protein n=1 Tax=Caldanaerobacter sp. TaxID=2930036 RepID=UPI003C72F8D9
MREMTSIENVDEVIKENGIVFFYFSTKDCGICSSLLPKLDKMLKDYPKVESFHIPIDEVPAASGKFSVFTVPTIVVYVDGREAIREARFISMDVLEEKLSKYYSLFFEESA